MNHYKNRIFRRSYNSGHHCKGHCTDQATDAMYRAQQANDQAPETQCVSWSLLFKFIVVAASIYSILK